MIVVGQQKTASDKMLAQNFQSFPGQVGLVGNTVPGTSSKSGASHAHGAVAMPSITGGQMYGASSGLMQHVTRRRQNKPVWYLPMMSLTSFWVAAIRGVGMSSFSHSWSDWWRCLWVTEGWHWFVGVQTKLTDRVWTVWAITSGKNSSHNEDRWPGQALSLHSPWMSTGEMKGCLAAAACWWQSPGNAKGGMQH